MTTGGADENHNRKLILLDEEIVRFDAVLNRIQRLMPEDIGLYALITLIRDTIFQLHNKMHHCEIVDFANSGLDRVVNPVDWFWQNQDDEREEGE
jgi:hypothetical protein